MVLSKKDLEDISKIIEEKITASLSNAEFIKNIADSVYKRICDKYEHIISAQKEAINSLKNEVNILKKGNKKLEKEVDDSQQFSRNFNVRIFGMLQESEKENTKQIVLKLFNEKMNIKGIKDSDIMKCHRVPVRNPSSDKTRPPAVLVRFYNDNIRAEVMGNRKLLKSTGIAVQDDLTKYRLSLMGSAIKLFNKNNVWSHNGNVFVKFKNRIHKIQNMDDINNIRDQPITV